MILSLLLVPKLLSNSDRYADDSVEARDLIDLAILRLQSPIPQASIEKAEKAYQVMRPLKRAIELLQGEMLSRSASRSSSDTQNYRRY